MRIPSPVLAFILGACTGGAALSVAGPSDATSPASAVVSAAEVTTRWAPHGKANIQVLARGSQAFLGRLWLAADAKVPTHRDSTEETIHVVSGSGTITIDGVASTIGPGDTVFMAAGAEVTYQNGPEPLQAIQVFAGPEPADKYAGWAAQH